MLVAVPDIVFYLVAQPPHCVPEFTVVVQARNLLGGGEGGVAIGFNPMKLVQGEISTRGYLVPVRYSEQDHKAIVSDVAIATLKFFREGLEHRKDSDRKVWAERFLEVWRDHVVYCAPILKDGSFESEHEWRLVVNLRPDDVARVEIQQRSALISRHLPLSFLERPCRSST